MQRRTLIKCLTIGSGVTLASACKKSSVLPVYERKTGGEIVIAVADLREGKLLFAHPDSGLPVSVVQTGPMQFAACLMSCTHMKCETVLHEVGYVCPCHGARFTLQGKVTRGPAERDLEHFNVRREGAYLYIGI
jgi:Rieske Fe-S protein